jgi:ribonuclease VapC
LFVTELGFRLVSISEIEFAIAIDVYPRFGNGRHPATENMGDCSTYACARANHASLLFKGSDFRKTDIAAAACPLSPPPPGLL